VRLNGTYTLYDGTANLCTSTRVHRPQSFSATKLWVSETGRLRQLLPTDVQDTRR